MWGQECGVLTVRLVGGRWVSTGNTLHVLKAAQLGLPVIPEKEGKHTRVCFSSQQQ